MKTFRVLAILSIMLALPEISGAQTNSQTETINQKSNSGYQSDTITFTVYGMDCPGCEGGLEKQVNKIPYVKYSKANWVNQELKVVVEKDSIMNIDELEKRVKKANFSLDKDTFRKKTP